MKTSEARILEIGDLSFMKEAFPERTTLLWTGRVPPSNWINQSIVTMIPDYFDATPETFAREMARLRAGLYDVVVAYLPLYSPWHPRHWLRSLLHDPRHPWSALTRVFGISWLRLARLPVPLVVLDLNDHFGIRRPGFFLLDRADVILKRELPVDRWHMLVGSTHPALPTTRVRANPRWQARLEKIRPISLPMPRVDVQSLFGDSFPEKTTDVFFSGNTTANSWVRRAGIRIIRKLAEEGLTIDIPDVMLPRDEFYRRMSRAWLAWSPSGFGWNCYRTGEAAQCLTVPVVDRPTIERYCPLEPGRHVIEYDVEGEGLATVIRSALHDKARLKEMALAARAHVQANLLLAPIASHILEAGFSAWKGQCAAKVCSADGRD